MTRLSRFLGAGLPGLLLMLAAGAGAASAHEFAFTAVRIELGEDGGYRVDMQVDVDALALGVSPATDSAEVLAALLALSPAGRETAVERARETIRRRVRIRFDDVSVRPTITFPDRDDPATLESEIPTLLGITARLEGAVPAEARELSFFASRAFGPVRLEFHRFGTRRPERFVLAAGERSPPLPLDAAEGPTPAAGAGFSRFLRLGFVHILPRGLDHILFVVGLFLLSARLGPLLWQVTAFTVAHSITLALSVYGVVSLPSRPVEALIALSIAWVAIENIVTDRLKPWRPVLVFAFGLLHGLGFAGALREIGLPRAEFLTAVVGFNVGVELGQLAVIASCLVLLGFFRERPWYRTRVVVPLSGAVAVLGLYWTVERLL